MKLSDIFGEDTDSRRLLTDAIQENIKHADIARELGITLNHLSDLVTGKKGTKQLTKSQRAKLRQLRKKHGV